VPAWVYNHIYKAWIEGSACLSADVLLSGGTDMLSDGGVLRDSRDVGPIYVCGWLHLVVRRTMCATG
jgi:hypothetical protein